MVGGGIDDPDVLAHSCGVCPGVGIAGMPAERFRQRCYPAVSRNLASNRIEFERFIYLGINCATVGEVQSNQESTADSTPGRLVGRRFAGALC